MRNVCLASLAIAFMAGTLAQAADQATLSAALKQRMALIAKDNQRQQEVQRATSALQARRHGLNAALNQLRQPAGAANPRQVEDLRRRKADTEAQLARLQTEVAALDRQIELSQLADPEARQTKAKQIETEIAEVDQQVQQAAAPIEQKYADVTKVLKETVPAFEAALRPHFKDASGAWGEAKVASVRWFENNTGQIHWQDAAGEQVAWAAVFVRAQPSGFGKPTKLDGKHGYSYMPSGVVMIALGHFTVHLHPARKLEEPATLEMVKALIEVDGLAAATAE